MMLLKGCNLVIDDDPLVGPIVEKATGCKSLSVVADFTSALGCSAPSEVHSIFLDVNLGTMDGLTLIRPLRSRYPDALYFVMTSSVHDSLIEEAFALGVDDFIQKPLRPAEIRARLQIRSAKSDDVHLMTRGNLRLYLRDQRLHGPNGTEYLGPKETKALHLLMKGDHCIVSKAQLAVAVWGKDKVSRNSIDQMIHRLRLALAEVGSSLTLRAIYGGKVHLG